MPVITCAERTSTDPGAQDAGWALNTAEDQLYYPFVSSCVTVTLVFENGVLGGHASQVTPTNIRQPKDNLIGVINRMKGLAPDKQTRGAFHKIYFIGTTDEAGWDLKDIEKFITTEFGQPAATAPTRQGYTPVDVVFDTKTRKLFSMDRKGQDAKGAARTIQDANDLELGASYL